MASRTVLAVADGPSTRLGRLVLAGEVLDAEPIMPASLRTMDAYVLSVLIAGEGSYRDAQGRSERIVAGAHTIVPPGVPHWYRTEPGQRWTELFAVFSGPLFDLLAQSGVLAEAGPRYPRPAPSIEALRAVLRSAPRSPRAAEHQLLALADWLLETAAPATTGTASELSADIADAAGRLSDDLTGRIRLPELAETSGLSYDTFRRHFRAQLGQSPAAFRSERRLQTAATLLRFTELNHREIARTLGFADEFHFSRRFRAHFGVPPSEYRRS